MYKGKSIAHVYPLNKPVKAQITIPGSKSYTNRALIIASLAKGTSILTDYSNSNDSLLLIKILSQIGIEIVLQENQIILNGNGGYFKEFTGTINAEDAGTDMRFLTALCALIPGEIILEGSPRMHQRPIKGLVDALLQLGANITYLDESGYPPIKIKGGNLHARLNDPFGQGGKIEIDASHSSQFISALLMIAPTLNSDLEIGIDGETASASYVDMTISSMKYFGAAVKHESEKYFISKESSYTSAKYAIEGDASSASYFFALAAITQSSIRINNLSHESLQGDVKFAVLLEQMGCKVIKGENYIEVIGTDELRSITADMKDMQDVAQTIAVVAAFAKGTTILRGLKNLEIKETKRLTALQTELTKMSVDCSTDGEQIIIHGGNPKGTLINTYGDHRMAMAFAIAGARIKNLQIESPGLVKKSFPDFWSKLKEIGVEVDIQKKEQNIVLIGFMGAGKTTIGKLLAVELDLPLLETDDEIIKRSGLKDVNEIFEKEGESFFRTLEKEVIADYAKKSNCIISCGGGVIENQDSIGLLRENSKILFLDASFETITERIKEQTSRPLFKDTEKARELYLQRLPLYKSYADEIIIVDERTPEEITQMIAAKLLTHA